MNVVLNRSYRGSAPASAQVPILRRRHTICGLMISLFIVHGGICIAYPLDGYDTAGIGRLEAARRIEAGMLTGRKQPKGALLTTAQVDLRCLTRPDFVIPTADADFTQEITALLGEHGDRYSISVLDLSDPENPRYGEHNGDSSRNPGSVGKLLIGLALFQALADIYPDDIDARKRLLLDTVIVADEFINNDHHTVRIWDREAETLARHPLHLGDRGSMWEYLDWMLSASSNAAAATLMKHAMLMRHFAADYPVSDATAQQFFSETPRSDLGKLLAATMQEPVTRNGLDIDKFRQGSFFTATGKRKVPGTNSYATSRELMRFLLLMEQGRLVDEFSSRELKRLLYVTERRIRYAAAPALWSSAVYFKSGSLYKCEPEPDFVCKKYHGNVKNLMNSVAIVESPAGENTHFYLVTLTSNVLRRNSAVDHLTLAKGIHELIEEAHRADRVVEPGAETKMGSGVVPSELNKAQGTTPTLE